MDGSAEVFADEVATESQIKGLLHFLYIGEGAGKCFVVAHVGNNDVAT